MIEKDDCKEIKQQLRIKFKQIRSDVCCVEKNRKIVENIRKSTIYKEAKNIMLFYPIGKEVDLRELLTIDRHEKNFFLPKTIETKIIVCPYESENSLTIGAYNIFEPKTQPIETPEILDLIILPALATDKFGNRLGYGKGCYDRFLNSLNKKIPTILPMFSELICNTPLPTNEFDVKADIVISDEA